MKQLVSILIPAYNAEQFIGETLESAIGQTWPHKEIIVVDDGSKDQTLAVARRFESGNVKVVTKSNEGAAATRNRAFSLCQGDYIQWLDADDLLAPDKIALQMQVADRLEGRKALLSSGWGHFMYRPHKAIFSPSPLWADLSPAEWLIKKLGQNLHMQTATWLVSRELTESAGAWDTRLLGDDDGEYFCRVLIASDGVRFVPNARVYYRVSGGARLSNIGRSSAKMEAQFVSTQLHISYLRSLEDSPRVREACLKYLQGLAHFYPERPDIVEQGGQLARSLGGSLTAARLPWKYAWIQKVFGWNTARRVQMIAPAVRWSLARTWDKFLFRIDRRRLVPGSCVTS